MFSAEPARSGEYGLTAEALLASPRGRSLCADLLDDRLKTPRGRVRREWADTWTSAHHGDARRFASKLSECVRISDPAGHPFDGSALMNSLRTTVNVASYWEMPDAEDQALANPEACEALRPIAQAVTVAVTEVPAVRWWAAPLDNSRQRCTQFLDGAHDLQEPQLADTAAAAQAWLAEVLDDEQSERPHPRDPSVFYSGRWWSSPALSRLPVTTRELPSLGAAGLVLVEDGRGWQLARCWPVTAQGGLRVYEIGQPDHWAALVERYPLDVTRSRQRDWRQASDWAGRWVIPDYAALAADWDAIHLTTTGYLTAAGIASPTGAGTRTMLAGWDPDATWWLNDALSFTSPPEDWREDDDAPSRWIQA